MRVVRSRLNTSHKISIRDFTVSFIFTNLSCFIHVIVRMFILYPCCLFIVARKYKYINYIYIQILQIYIDIICVCILLQRTLCIRVSGSPHRPCNGYFFFFLTYFFILFTIIIINIIVFFYIYAF